MTLSGGFALDAHLSFARPLTRAEAERQLAAWGLPYTLYGDPGGEVRGARLTGQLGAGEVRRLLQTGLAGGGLRAAELGLRGHLRAEDGQTEWMPWTRARVLAKTAWEQVELQEGVRYVLE